MRRRGRGVSEVPRAIWSREPQILHSIRRSGFRFRMTDSFMKRTLEPGRWPAACEEDNWRPARSYSISLTQMFLKLMGSLLSPCAWSLIGARSYFL